MLNHWKCQIYLILGCISILGLSTSQNISNKTRINTKLQQKPGKSTPLYKSSICYNNDGEASIKLACPQNQRIVTTIAFTALSQSKVCSFQKWDCILQEGSTQQCDRKDSCTVTATYEDSVESMLRCHQAGDKYMFFQVEYYCSRGTGNENVSYLSRTSSTSVSPYDIEQAIMNDTMTVGILGGSVLGFVFLIAIVTSFIYRIKTRSISSRGYDGPAEITTQPSTSSISSRQSIQPELARQGARCHLNFDFRRQGKFHQPPQQPQQPSGRGMTVWNGRSTTYMENG